MDKSLILAIGCILLITLVFGGMYFINDKMNVNIDSSKECSNNRYQNLSKVINSSLAVFEQTGKYMLIGENADQRLPMASTTKVMTALCVLKLCPDINMKFTIPKEAIGVEGSSIYLKEGEVWTIKDLLYGLMLRSGNDSAVALAIACKGNTDDFVDYMNNIVDELNLRNTHFTNPHGLHDNNHYTTAKELGIIACEAMNNEIFRRIVSTKTYKFTINNIPHCFTNKNKILSLCDGGNGIKTGYTKRAGRCLVSSCMKNGMQLVCVALNRNDMWNDSINAMNTVFNRLFPLKIYEKNKVFETIKSKNTVIPLYMKEDIIYPVEKEESININYYLEIKPNLNAGDYTSKEIGTLHILNGERLLFSKKVYSMKYELNEIDIKSINNFVLTQEEHVKDSIKQIFSTGRSCIS